MANTAAIVVSEYFKEKHDLDVKPQGEDGELLLVTVSCENFDPRVVILFSDDNTAVTIHTVIVDRIPKDKAIEVLVTLNSLNRTYRWAKFTVEEDGSVMVTDDAVIDLDTCGEEVDRCLQQIAEISDAAYPVIMKAMYA